MSAGGGVAWVAASRQLVVRALDDKLRMREGIMIARMVRVKVRAYQDVNVVRPQAKISEMFQNVLAVRC